MSAYAEYIHAKTDEEREEAMKGIRAEVEADMYFDDVYEHEDYDEDYDEDEE